MVFVDTGGGGQAGEVFSSIYEYEPQDPPSPRRRHPEPNVHVKRNSRRRQAKKGSGRLRPQRESQRMPLQCQSFGIKLNNQRELSSSNDESTTNQIAINRLIRFDSIFHPSQRVIMLASMYSKNEQNYNECVTTKL